MKKKITVIIPFLNEADNIPNLCEELTRFFAAQNEYDKEIIFVDDGSQDNSVEILSAEPHAHYDAKIISLSKNFGSHAALRAGIMHASGDFICFMYADLQDPINLINELFEESIKGNDICWATRETTENGFFERTFSKVYSSLMKKYAISTYPEKGFDIVMFSKKVQAQINSNVEANSSLFLQILTLGFKQTSIFYNKQARKKGKSKWTIKKKIKLFIDSFIAFSYTPIRFVTIVGITMFFIGIFWSLYLILRKLLLNDLASGWAGAVCILLIGFGITNISLGIIAEYLWRTLDSSRKRPVFIINDIIDITKK